MYVYSKWFVDYLVWFVDCFVVSLQVMTKGSGEEWLAFLLVMMKEQITLNSFIFSWMNKIMVVCGLPRLLRSLAMTVWGRCHCEQKQSINNHSLPSSLRGFEKAVAISVWHPLHPTHTVIAIIKPSLRGFEKAVAISVWQSSYCINN